MILGRTRKITSVLALALLLTASAAIGLAQRSRGGPGGGGGHGDGGGFSAGRLFNSLNLTTAQQTQIETIAASYTERVQALRDQLSALDNPTASILTGTAFNAATVRQAAQARAAIRVELEVLEVQRLSEIYAVLTAEQRALLALRVTNNDRDDDN